MASYIFTSLPDVEGFEPFATALDDAGDIVGWYVGNLNNIHGFLYSNGTYTTIDDPLAVFGTYAYGINGSGDISGQYVDGDGVTHGFVFANNNFITLDDPDAAAGPTGSTLAYGINDSGQVVGTFSDGNGEHGFLYNSGNYTQLDDPLGADGTVATAIDDNGDIVGFYNDGQGVTHGFLYSNGTYTTIDGPFAGPLGTVLYGINDDGAIAGYYDDANRVAHGFVYQNSTFIPVDSPLSTAGTQPTGINDAGEVVGQITPPDLLGFEFDGTTYTTLTGPEGAEDARALGINDSGEVVGQFSYPGLATQAFTYSNGTYTILSGPDGTTSMTALGINNHGQIVGEVFVNNGSGEGFEISNGNFFTFTDSNGPEGTAASAINNLGEIVGNYTDNNEVTHGFTRVGVIMTTVDDPLGIGGTEVNGINDSGVLVGTYFDSSGVVHGFMDDNGTFTTIDDPLGVDGSFTEGINNNGEIVGVYFDSNNDDHAYLYDNGTFTTIDDPNGVAISGIVSYPHAINDSGVVVGEYGPDRNHPSFSATPPPLIGALATNPSTGDLTTGAPLVITVTMTVPVVVAGTPVLILNDNGGTATYDPAQSTSTSLVFTGSVGAGQDATTLAVTAINLPNGATIQDNSGNDAGLELPGSAVFTGLQVETAPPVTTPSSLTVGANSGAQAIGILEPTDDSSFTITVTGLPTDGTVTLSDGVTPVTQGEALTPAQLAGLDFTPTHGISGTTSSFTYSVVDAAGNGSSGSATLGIAPPPSITAVAVSEGPGDYGLDSTIAIVLTMSQAVTVSGAPTLTLNDGNTATYLPSSSTSTSLVFDYTVLNTDNADPLVVDSVDLSSGAAIVDSSFATPADLSLPASATLTGVQIDSTPPTVTPASVTVLGNGGPQPMNLPVPTDLSPITIHIQLLPPSALGTMYLADGTTPVTAGETLTTAQFAGLTFAPKPGLFNSGSSFTYRVFDAAGNFTDGSEDVSIAKPPPTIVSVSASPASGDFDAGRSVTITLIMSNLVTVTGSPTLSLNDGGTATFDAAHSSGINVVFDYSVDSGENVSALAVTSVNLPGGATIADANNQAAVLSLPATADFSGLKIDTTPPATTPASLTVAGNTGAQAIGITAPTDSASTFRITATGLPTDGTVTLSDGTTAVTQGETLSTAQLTGLEFTPTPDLLTGSSSFTYSVVDAAGNSASGSAALAIASGAVGIDAVTASPSSGDLNANHEVTITLAMSGAVTVAGTPTLALNDGATATYDAAESTDTSLVFDYTVAIGDNSATLAVAAVDLPNGATITDGSGNAADLTLPGSATFTGLRIDTAAPVTTPVTLTVPGNTDAQAIGIAAPTDASPFTITVTGLPTDGLVTLADGTTPVTQGEILATADLTGLEFQPTAGVFAASSAFTYSVVDTAGNSASNSATLAIDPAPVSINAVTASPSSGDLGAGNAITITLTMSGPATVSGTPALTLNDGEAATYDAAASTDTSLAFDYTVAGGQNIATLAVNAINLPNGATITDDSGNAVNLALPGSATFTGLQVDTAAPATTPASLTVAGNSAATAIGIAAPTDASSFTITATQLPTDGLVTLADGTTPVTQDETLTTAQLTGLEFQPTAGIFNRSSSFTYSVVDAAGNASTGSATLTIGVAPPVIPDQLAGNGVTDTLMTNSAGALVLDEMSDGAMGYQLIGGLGPEWQFEGIGPLLGDGSDQFLLWDGDSANPSFGAVVTGEDDGGTAAYTPVSSIGPEWSFEGVGPIAGGGNADFLLWDGGSASPQYGSIVVGAVSGTTTQYTQIGSVGSEWQFDGVGNYLGDGSTGFLMWDTNSVSPQYGSVVVGKDAGGAAQYTQVGGLDPAAWAFEGSGDLLNDGKDSFLIRNQTNGVLVVGEVNGGTVQYTAIGAVGAEWQFLGVGDYDGANPAEFLMRNSNSGDLVIGTVASGTATYAQVGAVSPTDWNFHTGNVATVG